MQVARWWQKQPKGIECFLCPRRCLIAEGHYGFCNVRKNESMTLLTIAYNHPIAVNLDPIEKKPLYHFFPGSQILSIGTIGCNLACEFCQNWDISRAKPDQTPRREITPEAVIKIAQQAGSIGIAFTYNEPTIFGEYVLDIATLAHQSGLKTVMVSNGYITTQALDDIYPLIDAANIDLKSFSENFYRRYCQGQLKPVLEAIERIKSIGTLLEITTLLIPDLNDSDPEIEQLTRWIADHLGLDTPLHFSAFHPDYHLQHLNRTPKATLDRARMIARNQGLHYVYEGNVLSDREDATYCYKCGKLLIERDGFRVLRNNLKGNRCSCGAKIAIVQ